jgi:uncharacterized protein (DUF58 family)
MKIKMTPFMGVSLLAAFLLIVILFTGSTFFYFLLLTVVVSVVLMFLLIISNGRKLIQFLGVSNHEISAGDTVTVDVTTTNNSIFPIAFAKVNCEIYNKHNRMTLPTENIFFNPLQTIRMREEFVLNTRGIYNESYLVTELHDPLRLFTRTVRSDRPFHIIVYPKVHQLNYFRIPNSGYLGTNKIAKTGHEDYSSLKKVRPYTHGDSIKKIHWKISSKRDEFFVKEYESTASSRVSVFLDAFEQSYLDDTGRYNEDLAVEVAASIMKYALSQNIETSLSFHSEHNIKMESRDLGSYPDILKSLVTFVPSGQLNFSDLLVQETKKLEQGCFLVLITSTVDKRLIDTIAALKKRRFIISLVVTNKNVELHGKRELLTALNVKYYEVESSAEVKEKLEAFKG